MASTSRSTFTASQVCQLLCDESGNEIDAASDIEIHVINYDASVRLGLGCYPVLRHRLLDVVNTIWPTFCVNYS